MSIYSNFKPTYLYIKQHSVTGKLYFGKTTKTDPVKYQGSGHRWLRHIRKHGKEHVVTLWYELFTDRTELVEFALSFSTAMQITESKSWLNLKPENGLDGGIPGIASYIPTQETKDKISKQRMGFKWDDATKQKISRSNLGKQRSVQHARNISEARKTSAICKQKSIEALQKANEANKKLKICPHCNKSANPGNYSQHHGDNCKLKS